MCPECEALDEEYFGRLRRGYSGQFPWTLGYFILRDKEIYFIKLISLPKMS
jgi:hypothetical protein